jgi:hypothetical protein
MYCSRNYLTGQEVHKEHKGTNCSATLQGRRGAVILSPTFLVMDDCGHYAKHRWSSALRDDIKNLVLSLSCSADACPPRLMSGYSVVSDFSRFEATLLQGTRLVSRRTLRFKVLFLFVAPRWCECLSHLLCRVSPAHALSEFVVLLMGAIYILHYGPVILSLRYAQHPLSVAKRPRFYRGEAISPPCKSKWRWFRRICGGRFHRWRVFLRVTFAA